MVAQRFAILPLQIRENTMPENVPARFVTGMGSIGKLSQCVPVEVAYCHAISFSYEVFNPDLQVGEGFGQHRAISNHAFRSATRARGHHVVHKIGCQPPSYRLGIRFSAKDSWCSRISFLLSPAVTCFSPACGSCGLWVRAFRRATRTTLASMRIGVTSILKEYASVSAPWTNQPAYFWAHVMGGRCDGRFCCGPRL